MRYSIGSFVYRKKCATTACCRPSSSLFRPFVPGAATPTMCEPCIRRRTETANRRQLCAKTWIETAAQGESCGGGGAAVRNGFRRHTSQRARFMTSSILFGVASIDFKRARRLRRRSRRRCPATATRPRWARLWKSRPFHINFMIYVLRAVAQKEQFFGGGFKSFYFFSFARQKIWVPLIYVL